MLFSSLILGTLGTSALAFPFQPRNDYAEQPTNPQDALPACGPDTVTCKCPPNSFYQTSSSYAFWPVNATEITRITGNFLDTAWFGTSPEMTSGDGNIAGAKRWLYGELPDAKNIELIAEKLTFWEPRSDGGYYMKFQIADPPFWYQKKRNGTMGLLAGSWEIVDVRQINEMTYMLWDIHVCFMDPFDFAGFHESAMHNVTAILQKEGKMTGEMIGPITF